jgi:hypothetical protein
MFDFETHYQLQVKPLFRRARRADSGLSERNGAAFPFIIQPSRGRH